VSEQERDRDRREGEGTGESESEGGRLDREAGVGLRETGGRDGGNG